MAENTQNEFTPLLAACSGQSGQDFPRPMGVPGIQDDSAADLGRANRLKSRSGLLARPPADAKAKADASREAVRDVRSIDLSQFPTEHQPKIRKRLGEMPARFRNRYLTAMRGNSRVSAIEAHCWECTGWETNPADCTAPACSLYSYRPGI